jgi:hypothetical protein
MNWPPLDKLVIGWREWIRLPELGIEYIKAKIDTGARTSALHAYDIEEFRKHGLDMVRFKVHPLQRNLHKVVTAEAQVIEWREVRDSGGKVSLRPVIHTRIKIGILSWKIEVTLVNRDQMGFRMLLGRQAVRGQLLVDAGRSYVIGKKRRKKTKSTSKA